MKKVTFTITEDKVRKIAKKDWSENLSNKQIKQVLDMVEADEVLWKNIRDSIIGAVREITLPF